MTALPFAVTVHSKRLILAFVVGLLFVTTVVLGTMAISSRATQWHVVRQPTVTIVFATTTFEP